MVDLLKDGVQSAEDLRTLLETYIPSYLPSITNVDTVGDGRKLFNLIASLLRTEHFALDFRFRQSNATDVDRLTQAFKVFSILDYKSPGPAASGCTVRLTNQTGAVVGAPIPIPQYTVLKTFASPALFGLTTSSLSIPVGSSYVDAAVIQGQRFTGQAVAAALGGAYQAYKVSTRYIPREYLTVYANAVTVPRVDSLYDAADTPLCYQAVYDVDGYLWITFGDGTFGKCPLIGDAITADWIVCSGTTGNFTLATNGFSVLTGVLGQTLSAQQTTAATGGSNGPDVATVKRTAPRLWASGNYIRRAEDAEGLANDFSGVYRVRVTRPGGSVLRVYVMPDGGGTASPALLTNLQSYLQNLCVEGLVIEAYPLVQVPLVASCRVVVQQQAHRMSRSTISKQVRAELATALGYTLAEIGRGYKVSDFSALIENLSNGQTTDYVDISKFTREPRVVQSNPAAPEVHSFTLASTLTSSDTWNVIMFDATTYFVTQNGVLLPDIGTIGAVYASGGLSFIVGEPGDTFTLGDTYTIYTSRYLGNITLQPDEYMYYRQDSDFEIDVVYAEEDV